ncbi:MAG: TIGR02646 family protein, partial [bacterium]|nr:TIGR02646 family protein [bacterium]
MIKIDKNLNTIPPSLQSNLTNRRRKELINEGQYIDKNVYNSRYKMNDIKNALKNIYHNKCAYCEKQIEQFHVEHFRPKSIYCWLAYSWDNLLLACPTCNTHKDNHFELQAQKAEFTEADLDQIHTLAEKYNRQEENKFLNPEQEDPEPELKFDQNGTISSENQRIEYTINTCKLNRHDIKDFRKRIYDKILIRLEQRFRDVKKAKTKEKQKEAMIKIKGLLEDFQQDSHD